MNKKCLWLILLVVYVLLCGFLEVSFCTEEKHAKKEKAVDTLLEELKSHRSLVRSRAVEEIGNRRVEEAVPFLIEALKDPNLPVRYQACLAFTKIKNVNAVPSLIERLEDRQENWSIQIRAAEALAYIGDIRAYPHLISVLEYECSTLRKTLKPPIRKSYGSDDEVLELRLTNSLTKLSASSKETYIPLLLERIKTTNEMSKFRYYLAVVLGQLGEEEVVPILIDYLEKSGEGLVREKCARILGDLGDRRAIEPLKEALQDEFICVSTGDVHKVYGHTVRMAACRSLIKLGVKVENKGKGIYKVVD